MADIEDGDIVNVVPPADLADHDVLVESLETDPTGGSVVVHLYNAGSSDFVIPPLTSTWTVTWIDVTPAP